MYKEIGRKKRTHDKTLNGLHLLGIEIGKSLISQIFEIKIVSYIILPFKNKYF